MKHITIDESMELFVGTLRHCGVHLLEMSDDDIGYYIFEEFDGGAISFLHEYTLSRLREAKLITEEVSQKSAELRYKFMALIDTPLWDVDSVKVSEEWRAILELSDEIKALLGL